MSERARITAQKTEAKKENSVSRIKKASFSQSTSSPIDQILSLQRTIGNQAVQRLFKSGIIQARLRIGQPNDIYEQEADRVAEQVMQIPEPQIQRQPEEEEEEIIQTKPFATQITPLIQRQVDEEEEEWLGTKEITGSTPEVPPDLESRIQSLSGGGQPLPQSTRAFFGPCFGHDFGQVPIYPTGRKTPQTKLTINKPGESYEQEADIVARQVVDQTASVEITNPLARLTAQGAGRRQEEDDEMAMAKPVKAVQLQDESDSLKKGDKNSSRYTGAGLSCAQRCQALVRPEVPTFLSEDEGLSFGHVEWGKPLSFPEILGYVYYHRNRIEKWPSFNLKCERSIIPWGYKCTPAETDAVGAVWEAIATPEKEEGYRVTAESTKNLVFQQYVLKHPGYEYYVRVSGTAANNIAAAEQQHLNDYDLGWEITGEAVAKAINEAANEKPEVRSNLKAAKDAAVAKVVVKLGKLGMAIVSYLERGGRLEDALGPLMDNAYRQSGAKRDDTGKHSPGVRYVMTNDQKKRVLFEVNEDFVLDATPSSQVVNLDTILLRQLEETRKEAEPKKK